MAKQSNSDKDRLKGMDALSSLLDEANNIGKTPKKRNDDPKNIFLSDSGESIKFNRKHPTISNKDVNKRDRKYKT